MAGMKRLILAAVTSVSLVLPAVAESRVPLQEDKVLDDGLTIVAAVNYLRRNCDTVGLRVLRSWVAAQGLKNRALELGYDRAEIEVYFNDEAQKARVKAQAKAYLEARGVVWDDPASFCTYARTAVAADKGVGRYIYLK